MSDVKTLAQMTAEIVGNNTAKGWYENCATFPEAMALLHSEVSEALEAWRENGLADATCRTVDMGAGEVFPKPEGVGSEFADIFIRLLDDAWLFGQVDLEAGDNGGRYAVSMSFPANMNALHDLISAASVADDGLGPGGLHFTPVLMFLRQLCEFYGIDLLAEYEKKMAYNRTREYRHGNKWI